jgi:L-lactate dehydrogenase complex protein LldE
MRIGLFIPCYINQFYPQVGIATLELLEKFNVEVAYPAAQTCCGQPMANAGYEKASASTCQHLVDTFQEFEYIVTPSGSCAYHIKKHYDTIPQTEQVSRVRSNTYELCDFLVNILKIENLAARFPYKVGLHKSCHGLRGLHLGSCSEIVGPSHSTEENLLNRVQDLKLVELRRKDECCGFGGTFAVFEEAISVKMGKDRVQDHLDQEVEVITATDMSCLMHLEGIIERRKDPIRVMHIAEILNANIRIHESL